MPRGKEAGHHPQGLPTARHSRAHRSDRKVDDGGRLLVAHSLQTDEKDYRPLLLGQFGEGPLQITQLEPHSLRGWKRQVVVQTRGLSVSPLAHVTPSETDMLIVKNREQPGAKIGSWIP